MSRVQKCRRVASVFKALGHPARLCIIQQLSKKELCVCELTQIVALDISTVSNHLSILKNVGLIANNKRGLQVFYRLANPCIISAIHCLKKRNKKKTS